MSTDIIRAEVRIGIPCHCEAIHGIIKKVLSQMKVICYNNRKTIETDGKVRGENNGNGYDRKKIICKSIVGGAGGHRVCLSGWNGDRYPG